ncbi:ABC transporter substrate-binding protein [Anaerostipes sp.]|uniref:ABC transporter substrate-binding protein n=1 Tax=Anaerostipes sp. TaxID=1872530 RepID=UPI0025BC5E3D|nr:ABC transporter substrate-binding protein [Anaerostipes sp.]
MEKAKEFFKHKKNRAAAAAAAAVILGIGLYWGLGRGGNTAELLYKAEKKLPDQKGREMVIGIQNYQGGLHPAAAEYSGEKAVSDLLFSPLIRISTDGTTENVLADSVDVSSDHKEYTVKLKSGLKYSDGSKLTAAKVKKALLLLGDGRSSFAYKDCFARLKGYETGKLEQAEDLKGIQVKDETTLVFKFTEADPSNMYLLTGGIGEISDRSKNKYLYTGAYRLKGQPANLPFELEANPEFYNGEAKQKKITIKNINSNNIEEMLTKGEADAAQFQANKSLISSLQKSGVISLYYGASDIQTVLDFCQRRKSAVNKKEVRQAVCYAFQKEKFAEDSAGDSGQQSFSNFKQGSFLQGTAKEAYPYSKDDAQKALESAGYKKNKKGIWEKDGKELSLTLKADGILYADLFVKQFSKDMKAAGIKVKTTDSEEYDLYYHNTAVPELTSVRGFLDERNFQDEKITAFESRLKKAGDLKEAGKICRELDERITEQALCMPVYAERKFTAVGNGEHNIKVKNMEALRAGCAQMRKESICLWQIAFGAQSVQAPQRVKGWGR